MNITPKTHAQQVRRAAERKAEFTPYITRIAYTTSSGDERVQERLVTEPPTRRVCENTLALALKAEKVEAPRARYTAMSDADFRAAMADAGRDAVWVASGSIVGSDIVQAVRECPEIAKGREHGIFESVADLPGDRSIGYCVCGEYVDTGTADDRF